jgi:polysaccharide pyruvyl transferase WcaK-like protein
MKIIISGGWGYGNLGDDAILDSTIRQLQRQFPGSQCVVLTYDLVDSAIHAADGITLRIGAHGLTDGGGCELFRPSMVQDYSLPRKAWVRAKFAFTETAAWFKYVSKASTLRELQAELATADLFVMAGGGYFNEKWMNKTRAQLLELRMAAQAGVPSIILGPTIGRFQGAIRHEIESCFRKARLITVRDEFSFAETTQWSEQVSVVPDIALSHWLPAPVVSNGLGIVFTNAHADFSKRVAQAIRRFIEQSGEDWPVKLFVTRRWKYDLRAAISLQEELQSRGVACDLVMPSNFRNLEKGLAACRMLISENLHGLILAARNLVPVVAVNDYPPGSPNYKKFIGFLAQSNSQDLFFNADNDAESISNILLSLARRHELKQGELRALREQVAQQYEQTLSGLAFPLSGEGAA